MTMSADQVQHRLLNTPAPPELGPERRPGTLGNADVRSAVEDVCTSLALSGERQQTVLALTLLWHDHLDPSHRISQGIETADGSYIHAMMHRREPDYWNSKYWWRQAGAHPVFPGLGRRASDHLHACNRIDLEDVLVHRGVWDPNAFVNICESVTGLGLDDPQTGCLRELQQIEFEVLLEYLVQA